MLSKELYIMDRNTERLMVTELQEEVEASLAREKATLAKVEDALTEAKAAQTENTALKDKNAKLLAWARKHGYQE